MSTNGNPWGGDRYNERAARDDERAYDDDGAGRASAYGRDNRSGGYGRGDNNSWEERSFTQGAGYDPYVRQGGARNYGGQGYGRQAQDDYRDAYRGASDYRTGGYGYPRYSDNQAIGSQLHQGYRSNVYATRGDAQGYSSQGYGDRGYTGQDDYKTRERYGREGERGFWDQTRDEIASWFGDDEAAARRRIDESNTHRGKGPKGYTRSDDRIREDINDRLTDDYRLDASDIEVKVSGGEVTLDGQVQRRDDKRRAEDLAEAVAGVKHVQNNLRLKPETATAYTAGATTSPTTATSTAPGATPRN
jgi:osmotically-inducible protein OsmY